MPNPYLLVAFAAAVALAAVLGYRHGIDTERGRAALAQQETGNTAAKAARSDAEAESERREEAALRDARDADAARDLKLKGQIDALEADRPDCRWPEPRRVLLNAAVDAANGRTDATAIGLHGELPRTAEARQ